jgi:hypothetical protein
MEGCFHINSSTILRIFNPSPDILGNIGVFDTLHNTSDHFIISTEALQNLFGDVCSLGSRQGFQFFDNFCCAHLIKFPEPGTEIKRAGPGVLLKSLP